MNEPASAELLDDLCKIRRRGRQVEQAVARRAVRAIDLLQNLAQRVIALIVGKLGTVVVNPLGQRLPDGGIDRAEARELSNALLEFHAELFVGLRAAGKSDDAERRRKLAFVGEIVQRRDELAMCEVARRAENHQHARLWCPSAD